MNNSIKFELAKLLKEKSFTSASTSFSNKYFNILGEYKVVSYDVKIVSSNYEAPTIAEVVMWLYEKHGIWISVTSISQESWQCHMCRKGDSLGKCYLEDFYTPTEAYEAAIEYTLNNLI